MGQLITEDLLGGSVGRKGAAGMGGSTLYDKSNKTSVVEEFHAVGNDGELIRRL